MYNAANFLSEGVRYGASQKKRALDSTKGTARVLFTFWDVPQIAAYHKKFFLFHALQLYQFGIYSTLGNKVVVLALLDNATLVDNEDAVGIHNGREAVGNNH